MKFPALVVLLASLLQSKADDESLALSSTTDNTQSVVTPTAKVSNNSFDTILDDNLDMKGPYTGVARLLEISRKKLEGGKLEKQSSEHDQLEVLLPEANAVKLKYAALMEENSERKNDDADVDTDSSKNIGSPRIFSNPKFKQIFRQSIGGGGEENRDVTRTFYPRTPSESSEVQDRKSAPLELTLGGYQRPSQQRRYSAHHSQISNQPQQVFHRNEGMPSDNIYDRGFETPFQGRFHHQPNVQYVPNLQDPFQIPHARYNFPSSEAMPNGMSFRYPEFPQREFQNLQTNNAPLGYNNVPVRNNEIGAFPPVMKVVELDARIPQSPNAFPIPTAANTHHVFRTDAPLSHQRIVSAPESMYPGNSYPMFSSLRGDIGVSRSPDRHLFTESFGPASFGIPVSPDQSFMYPRNAIAANEPVNTSPNGLNGGFLNPFYTSFAQQPTYLIHKRGSMSNFGPRTENGPDDREDGPRTSKNGEQKAESVSKEQDFNPKSNNDNSYLNYPTKQAGYATQEQLPAQNKSTELEDQSDKDLKVHIGSTGSPEYFPIDLFSTGSPIGRHHFSYFPNNPFINNASSFPSSPEENSPKNSTKGFDIENFYKNLQVPIQFNHRHRQSLDKGTFLPYPENSQNGADPSYFTRNLDNRPSRYPGGARSLPQSPYDFFNNYGNENLVDDLQVPKCAKDTNTTVCFEDADYPKSEILHSLDSEALLLLRIIPPSSSDTSVDSKTDSKEVEEDTNICSSDIQKGHPFRAMNTQGKWKIVVNLDDPTGRFNQNVVLENCRDVGQSCSHTDRSISSRCVQKYSLHRLFVWNRNRGLHSDVFKLPMSCSCQIARTQQ